MLGIFSFSIRYVAILSSDDLILLWSGCDFSPDGLYSLSLHLYLKISTFVNLEHELFRSTCLDSELCSKPIDLGTFVTRLAAAEFLSIFPISKT